MSNVDKAAVAARFTEAFVIGLRVPWLHLTMPGIGPVFRFSDFDTDVTAIMRPEKQWRFSMTTPLGTKSQFDFADLEDRSLLVLHRLADQLGETGLDLIPHEDKTAVLFVGRLLLEIGWLTNCLDYQNQALNFVSGHYLENVTLLPEFRRLLDSTGPGPVLNISHELRNDASLRLFEAENPEPEYNWWEDAEEA